jgi:hypothetical protein
VIARIMIAAMATSTYECYIDMNEEGSRVLVGDGNSIAHLAETRFGFSTSAFLHIICH